MAPLRLHLALAFLLAASVSAVAPVNSDKSAASTQRKLQDEEGDETLNELMVDLEEIEEQQSELESEEFEIEEAMLQEAGEDDDYMGCLCPCELAADPEGGVAMTALDESLFGPDGSTFLCVADEVSVTYNIGAQALCDESCFDFMEDGDDAALGDDSEGDDFAETDDLDYEAGDDDYEGDDETGGDDMYEGDDGAGDDESEGDDEEDAE